MHKVCGSEEEKERGHPTMDVFQKVEQKERVKKMKKFLALIVACVTVASSYAATVYSSSEFMTAAPVMMKGTLKVNTWMLDSENCAMDKGKVSFPVYFAFCQPCINCKDCVDDVTLGFAALYIVDKNSSDKTLDVTVLDLTAQTVDVTSGANVKKGDVRIGIADPGEQTLFGVVSPITLFGEWNLKTWFTGTDTITSSRVKATMGIIQKLDGCVDAYSASNALWSCGTLALRRDDSFTKTMMMQMTDSTTGSVSNPFLNCGPEPIDLDTCEEVMDAPSTVGDYSSFTMVETYILKKSNVKPSVYDIDGLPVAGSGE